MAKNDKMLLTNLKEILRTEVKLTGERENVRILETNLPLLIKQMELVSPLFKAVYQRIYYTGSYYDGLRVKNATEFDLNLVLAFPKNMDLEIRTTNSPPSFCTCKLKNKESLRKQQNFEFIGKLLREFFDERTDFFLPDKIRRWLQGVFDSALLSFEPSGDVKEIRKSSSGPALTIYIKTTTGTQLDVDLVPVLEFKYPAWPDGARKSFKTSIPDDQKYWFIVPKPPQANSCKSCQNYSYQWRFHFPGVERHLLHNKGCVKPIIKLLKLLRDKQDWRILASYYLKTVVMHAVIKPTDQIDWNESKMDKTFIRMLKHLQAYVQNKCLPYLFYEKCNLISKMGNQQAENIDRRLSRIIQDIENDPQKVFVYM
ncbi:cyclic GMP-AMP synthase-like receptor isoform X1 [Centruroides vittatus]|uniref:cyclic GMP-AMP synthase-like receptor isoform X1 n=1 Tax=Centruroides vittatus TaxID=120091 RepID=UPI00350E8F3C